MKKNKIVSLENYRSEREVEDYLKERAQALYFQETALNIEHNIPVSINCTYIPRWIQICEALMKRYQDMLLFLNNSEGILITDGRQYEDVLTEYYLKKVELDHHLIRLGGDRKSEQHYIFEYEMLHWKYWAEQFQIELESACFIDNIDQSQYGMSGQMLIYCSEADLPSFMKGLRVYIDHLNHLNDDAEMIIVAAIFLHEFQDILGESSCVESDLLDRLHQQLLVVTQYNKLISRFA
ncbi:hypothetical protein HGO21_16145 [Acinetobacter sp. CUI P1]|nr:hypothetical protein [Acinetobacter sp. CUI P1]